jgi:hypothetical protein
MVAYVLRVANVTNPTSRVRRFDMALDKEHLTKNARSRTRLKRLGRCRIE